MINDYSAAQLMDMNREKLGAARREPARPPTTVRQPNYTPVDVTAMVEALSSIGGVEKSRRDGRSAPPPPTAAKPPISSAAGSSSRRPIGAGHGPSPLSSARTTSVTRWPDRQRRDRRRLSDRQPVVDAGDGKDVEAMTSEARRSGATGARPLSSPARRRRWRGGTSPRWAGVCRSGRSREPRPQEECEPVKGTKGMIAPP